MNALRRAFTSEGFLNILGVRVNPLSIPEAASRIARWAGSRGAAPRVVLTSGVHGIIEAHGHPDLAALINSADLNLPDGMPLVWLGRLAGFAGMQRVFGPDLMLAVCAETAGKGVGHFFCGGQPGVAQELGETLSRRFPGLNVTGTLTPPMTPPTREDLREMGEAWTRSSAGILWLGVSTPKQERWAAEIRRLTRGGVIITVGAAFDYNTNRIKRAPAWMQKMGFEWFFRWLQEPRRLFFRYLRNNPLFLYLVLLQATGFLRSAGDGRRNE